MLYERLSEIDKETMKYYIAEHNECYGEYKDVVLDKVLRAWDKNKSIFLFNVFNNDFILSKEVCFQKSQMLLETEMFEDMEIIDYLSDLNHEISLAYRENYENNNRDDFEALLDVVKCRTLIKNKIPKSFVFNFKNGVIIKGHAGMKPMKVIKKLCEQFNFNFYEEFRIKHSQILNQRLCRGKLCLSIHPLDYMTMSDNASDWRTCMNWERHGGYRSGTIEMMNSPYIIVAYLAADHDMNMPGKHTWNNKKWRTLVLVSPNKVITTIREYPYYNEQLNREIVNWMCDLMENAGYKGFNKSNINVAKQEKPSELFMYFTFKTNKMYNDFGLDDHYYCLNDMVICDEKNEPSEFNYSGSSTCIICGEPVDRYSSSDLCCHTCITHKKCSCCGRYHNKLIYIEETNDYVCSMCYDINYTPSFCDMTKKYNYREKLNITLYAPNFTIETKKIPFKIPMWPHEIANDALFEEFGVHVKVVDDTFVIKLDEITKHKDRFFRRLTKYIYTRRLKVHGVKCFEDFFNISGDIDIDCEDDNDLLPF